MEKMTIVEIKDENHWHQLRKENVGASDVAALFPCGSFKTHFELWAEKSGKIEPEQLDCERVDLGHAFEWPIVEVTAKRNGWVAMKPAGYYTHPSVKGMGCTPDAILVDEDGSEFLGEIKFVDYGIFKDQWVDDEPPLKYLLQLQHQLACTGHTHGKIIAYVSGSGIKIYSYDRHDSTISMIEQAVTRFWQDVEEGKEPEIAASDYDVVRSMYQSMADEVVDLSDDNELPTLCNDLNSIKEKRLMAEKEEKRLKAEIINKLGGAREATTNGFLISYPEIITNVKAKEAHTRRSRRLTIKEAM